MKSKLSLLLLFLLATDARATEFVFSSIDCDKENHPLIQSRIIITNSIPGHSLFTIKIAGGIPLINQYVGSSVCMDPKFNGAKINPQTQSVDGLVLFKGPELTVVIPGNFYMYVPGTLDVVDRTYDVYHAYKFLLEGDKLTMISDAMIGNLKDSFNSCLENCEDLGTYIGHGELIRYNEEFPKIVYQLKQN